MSIRVRLALWYGLVLCAGLVLCDAVVLWQTARLTGESLDQTLQQRARDTAAALRLGPGTPALRPETAQEISRQLGETALWVRVLDARGQPLARGGQGPSPAPLPAAALGDLRPGVRTWAVSGASNAPEVRVVVLPVLDRGRRVATVQVATTTHQVRETNGHLLLAMGVSGVAIVLAGALAGLFLADRALRPVDRITRLAAGIGADDLHRRVCDEVWGPGRARRDELGRLARAFDELLERLQGARERQRRLTADIAHELGTPVATIIAGAEIALRHPHETGASRRAFQHIVDEGRYLDRVLDELLMLTRADAGALALQRELVEIDEVCRQAAHALAPLARELDMALELDLPPRTVLVRGDELRLAQVARNLLDNALRYTPSGGRVVLTLRQEGDDGHGEASPIVTVSVSDTGPGIPPDEVDHIFERFHRAAPVVQTERDGRGRRGGSGLGLAICKAIVRAHGGEIRVEREPRAGACVVVTLPGLTAADTMVQEPGAHGQGLG